MDCGTLENLYEQTSRAVVAYLGNYSLPGIRDGKPDRKLGLSLLLKAIEQLFFFAYKINELADDSIGCRPISNSLKLAFSINQSTLPPVAYWLN